MTEPGDGLRPVLDRFPAAAGRAFRVTRPAHAALAQVWLLDDRLVLRARPAGSDATDALATELALADQVRPLLPAPLPDPLPTRDGARWVVHGPSLYTLHAALPGRVTRTWQALGAAPADERRDLLRRLRALHDATRGRLPGGDTSWLAAEAAARLPAIRPRLSRATTMALEAAVDRVAASHPAPADRTFVHGDFHPGNLLVDDDGQLTGILDLDWCRAGDPLEDLAYTTMMLMRDYDADAVRGEPLEATAAAYGLPSSARPRLADRVLLYAAFDVHVFATAGPFPGRERYLGFQLGMVEQLARG